MATTTYFGWETPDDTDLVKDGAAAIRTLGSAIDTSMSQLEGGTTGQILSKTSATDMAFTWINNDQGDITGVTAGTGISGGGTSGAVTVTNSMATAITTAGDLIKGTGSGTFDRLGIGSTSQVLTVVAGAPAWVSPASAADSFTLLGTGTLTGATTITVSSISGQNQIYVLVKGASAGASAGIGVRLNGDTGSNYAQYGPYISAAASYNSGNFTALDYSGSRIDIAYLSNNTNSVAWGGMLLQGCNGAGKKMFSQIGGADPGTGGTGQTLVSSFGLYNSASTISSVSLFSSSGNFDGGTFEVYGSA